MSTFRYNNSLSSVSNLLAKSEKYKVSVYWAIDATRVLVIFTSCSYSEISGGMFSAPSNSVPV